MEKILPLDVLINIFSNYLFYDDILSVYNTCTYWKTIIDRFNIWKTHWYRLIYKAENTCLKENTCTILKTFNIENKDLKQASLKLFYIIYNRFKKSLHRCYTNEIWNKKVKIDAALLKTHHSHCVLKFYELKQLESINRIDYNYTYTSCHYHRAILNRNNPEDTETYLRFRSPEEIIKNIDLINIHKNQSNLYHINIIKQFFYIYPMGLSSFIKKEFLKHIFQLYHVKELILIPRVLMLCENLEITDALVIYSTSRTTEIAVVLNGCIVKDKWCEIPIGGWNITKNIYHAFQWMYPNITENICHLENPKMKNLCWIKPCVSMNVTHQEVHGQINENLFTLKNEQYLAAEIMYTELQLCSVVQKLFVGLTDIDITNCLSHVLLTGGNCKLKHLNTRINLDLIKTFPKFKNIISTSLHCDNSLVYQFPPYEPRSLMSSIESIQSFEAGKKCRLKIEDYISNNDIY